MSKFFYKKYIYFFLVFNIYITNINSNYTEIDLTLKKFELDYELPLYIKTNDTCTKWVPALFSPLLIINSAINDEDYANQNRAIFLQNPASIKKEKGSLEMKLYRGDVSIFQDINIAKTKTNWPNNCQFGLGYSDVFPEGSSKNFNALKNLILTHQIEKNIFSFGKWDIDNEFFKSKLYIGDAHENFLQENVGNCKIMNDSGYFGCIFDDFIFLNKTYSLINEQNNKPYIIYFSSEFNTIYFPKNFENKILEKCHKKEDPFLKITCEELQGKDYLTLKLRSNNMNISLEVDNLKRYYDVSDDGWSNILFHDPGIDYIIFPLTMLKNFHVQFDIENNNISFYSNDTSILELPKKIDPKPNPEPETQPSQEPENTPGDGVSLGLIIFLSILGILLIGGLGYGGFLIWKKNQKPDLEKNFNKYSKFDDEDINENKLVY